MDRYEITRKNDFVHPLWWHIIIVAVLGGSCALSADMRL